jgi:hypothetical protein
MFPQIRPKFLIDEAGNKTAVQLSLEDYHALLERLENAEDIAIFNERRHEETVPWEAVKAKLMNRERV